MVFKKKALNSKQKQVKMADDVGKAEAAPTPAPSPSRSQSISPDLDLEEPSTGTPSTVKNQQQRRRSTLRPRTPAGTPKAPSQEPGGVKQTRKPSRGRSQPKVKVVGMDAATSTSAQHVGNAGGSSYPHPQNVGGGTPRHPQSQNQNEQGFQGQQQQQMFNPGPVSPRSNPLVWAGMKDIRDYDIDEVLDMNWNSKMPLVAWAPNRIMTATPENDFFIRTFNDAPWREQGNVLFFCADGKIVRCHAVLLYGIVPFFTKQLLEMQNFPFNPYVKDLPYIPLALMGVEQQVVEHLINLMTRGVDYVTGQDVSQLKKVMELLNMTELVICIAPTGMNIEGYVSGEKKTPSAVPTGIFTHPSPLDSRMMAVQTSQIKQEVVSPPQYSALGGPSGSGGWQQTPKTANIQLPGMLLPQPKPQNNPKRLSGAESGQKVLKKLGGGNTQNSNLDSKLEIESLEAKFNQRQESVGQNVCGTAGVTFACYKPADANMTAFQFGGMSQKGAPQQMVRVVGGGGVSTQSVSRVVPGWRQSLNTLNTSLTTGVMDVAGSPVDDKMVPPPVPVTVRVKRYSSSDGYVTITKRKRQHSGPSGPGLSVSDEDEDPEETLNLKVEKRRRPRKTYDKQQKEDALQALNGGDSVRDVADRLGLKTTLISRWKYEAKRAEDSNGGAVVALNDDDPDNATATEIQIEQDHEKDNGAVTSVSTSSPSSTTVTAVEHANRAVTTVELANSAVSTVELANSAVTPVSNEQEQGEGLPSTIEGLLYRPQTMFPKKKMNAANQQQQEQPMTFYVNENGPLIPEETVLRYGLHQYVVDNPRFAQQFQQHQIQMKADNDNGPDVPNNSQETIESTQGDQQQQQQDVPANASSVEALFGVPFPFTVPVAATSEEVSSAVEDME